MFPRILLLLPLWFSLFIFSLAVSVNYKNENRSIVHQISSDVYACSSTNPTRNLICNAVVTYLNEKLEGFGISIDNQGLLYEYSDPKDINIPTGHSCSTTAAVEHTYASVRFRKGTKLSIRGNILKSPLTVALRLPIDFNSRVNMKQRFGFRFFGRCKRYGSDTYSLNGHLSTDTKMLIVIALLPRISSTTTGSYKVVLEPRVKVAFDFELKEIKYKTSGKSPIATAWTYFMTKIASKLGAVDDVVRGRSIKSTFDQMQASSLFRWSNIFIHVLDVLRIPQVRDFVKDFLNDAVDDHSGTLTRTLQDRIEKSIRQAINTDQNGQKVLFVQNGVVREEESTTFTEKRLSIQSIQSIQQKVVEVQYHWSSSETNLNSASSFFSEKRGPHCGSYNGRYVQFNGDDISSGGKEVSTIRIGQAMTDNRWYNIRRIYFFSRGALYANWHSRSGGIAYITVRLKDEGSTQYISNTEVRKIIRPGTGSACSTSLVAWLYLTYVPHNQRFYMQIM